MFCAFYTKYICYSHFSMYKLIVYFVFFAYVADKTHGEAITNELTIVNVDRSIDLTTQVVKISSKITLQSNGKSAIGYFHYATEPFTKDLVSYVGATTANGHTPLKVKSVSIKEHENILWRINLRENLKPGKQVTVNVDVFLTHALKPYPAAITQKEKQLMLYTGNVYFFSPYPVTKQSTSVSLGTKNIESFTKLKPYTQADTNVQYGPYSGIVPFSIEELSIHYENNSPFLTVVSMSRVLEVSHWGNVAVEESISLEHQGAALKGSFSRFAFQRDSQSGLSSVKSFKTILPASAKDVYYRDEIGNISTSNLRVLSDSSELDLRPRFPIFGGWKTKYMIGYNIPSYEYLYNSGSNFILKMRLVDHVFDDMIIDELTTKIILPEGARDIKLSVPFAANRHPDEKHYTYLDTIGRPVIVVKSKNLVESHIQEFELGYIFPRILMLQEPVLAIVGFFSIFLIGIIFVRLDFTISSDSKKSN